MEVAQTTGKTGVRGGMGQGGRGWGILMWGEGIRFGQLKRRKKGNLECLPAECQARGWGANPF